MAKNPTELDIQLWIAAAMDIFKSIMPPIDKPYPQVIITNGRNFRSIRTQLINDLACKNTNIPKDSIMEYILGDKGDAILIRQNLLPDDSDEHFCWFFWHELGHFYAINSEDSDLYHYNDPGLADESQIVKLTTDGPVLGLSDERLKQEGYWFWQEFIAEAISKYVSFKHRSTTKYYHPELLDWHPDNWGGIVDRLMDLLDDAFWHYSYTIDGYALAHYFANLIMDDYVALYIKAAKERKLKVYRDGMIVLPDEEIEPTCVSDVDDERFRIQLWKMKELLEGQVKKECFWKIDEDFLLDIGTCIGELMFAKLNIVLAENAKKPSSL